MWNGPIIHLSPAELPVVNLVDRVDLSQEYLQTRAEAVMRQSYQPSTDKWDRRFLMLAAHIAGWSKDPSTKVGSVIVGADKSIIACGFNGFPQDMRDDEAMYANREMKLRRVIHAEMNALQYIRGADLRDATIYTYPFMPCDRCAMHLIQAKLRRFVYPKATPEQLDRWGLAFVHTLRAFREVGAMPVEIDL